MKNTFGRRGLSLFLALVMCLTLVPAVFAEDPKPTVTIDQPSLDLTVGDSETLNVSLSGGIEIQEVKWSSDNTSVATVNATTGAVTAVAAGKATITAACTYEYTVDDGTDDTGAPKTKTETDTVTGTCEVNVKAAPIQPTDLTVTLDASSIELLEGNKKDLTATVTAEPAGADITGVTYTWSSSEPTVATVSGSKVGAVTGIGKGKATITLTVKSGSITKTAQCEVDVITKMSNLALTPSGSVTLDVGRQSTVTATPNPNDPDMKVEWSSENPDIATAARQSTDGRTGIISARNPGETIVTASIGAGNNMRTNTLKVEVSGITLAECPSTVKENETVLLPGINRYGAAKLGTVSWQSSNPSIAQISGSSVAGRGPGTATITAYVGTYEASFNISVSSNSEVTLEYGSLRVDQTLSFSRLLSDIAAQAPGGLSHVTGLSVPTSQGTLFYKYTSSDEPNEGVAQNGSYYYSPGTGQKGLADVTFVPNPTYGGGTVTITYTVVSKTNQNYSCRILVNVEPNDGTDIVLSATNLDPAWFSADQFGKICVQETGNTLDYVIFSLPPARQGTLYTDFISTDNYGGKVAAGAQYKTKELDKIVFVPADGFTGAVTIYYTGRSVSTRGGTFTGKVIINVGRESLNGSNSDLYYSIPQGGTVTFDDAKFNSYYKSITGSSATLSYIRIEALPAGSQGTLYYNYRSASSTGSRVTTGTSYYYGSRNPRLDLITFAPVEGFSGTVLIPFTGWDTNGVRFAGTVEIVVGGSHGTGDIYYTCLPGRTVTFDVNDFTALSRELTGRTLNYISFQDLPNNSQGSLYHNSARISSTGSRYYNTSGTNRIKNLSFHAASGFTGSVNIPFVGYTTSTGETFNGVITIESVDYGSDTIQYTATTKEPAVFERDDFDDLSQWATRNNVSSVKFDIPATSRGDLYQNYRSLTSKGSRITSSNTSISASSLDRMAFIPASGFLGTVSIGFTATAYSNGGTFTGTVEIVVNRPGADVTVNYSTKVSPVTFRAADFQYGSTTLSSIRFTAMPSASAGYLYYRYTSPTQYERQASTSSTYNVSGSNLISDLTFVPRAGFTGTVVLPFVGTNSNRTTFEGEVVISVNPVTYSAYFNDMGGYSDLQRAAVDYLYEAGVTNGVSSTQYGPELNITRGDFALMIYRAFHLTPSTTGYFNDVSSTAYYAQAVNTLHAMGIVNGVGKGSYAPTSPVSRQDAICMVQRAVRAMGWVANDGPSGLIAGYSDGSSVAGYAQGAMNYAVMMGYLPLTNGQLAPRANLTRVDMAQILHRVMTY